MGHCELEAVAQLRSVSTTRQVTLRACTLSSMQIGAGVGTGKGSLVGAQKRGGCEGLELHGQHDEYSAYCFYSAKTLRGVFRSRSVSRPAVVTVRFKTLTTEPFANLSKAFSVFFGFTVTDAAVNSAPKNGVGHP
jgi:hypothetical protein